MKTILLRNELVKMQHRFFILGGTTKIEVNPCQLDYATTTSGEKLELNNIYTIELFDYIENTTIQISFKCNSIKNGNTYSKMIQLKKNGRTYSAQRYFYKYTRLVCEIAYSLGLQENNVN